MKTQNILLSVVTVVVLSFQFMRPVTVHADGETTPTPDNTPEVTTTPDPIEEPEIPEIASTPAPPEPTVDLVETNIPLPQTDQAEPAAEPAATTEIVEGPSVSEILAEIPEGTDVVVLDENGEPEPLATQEAAEIIAESDPVWCPEGVSPGGPGCTSPVNTTVSELIVELTSGSYSGSGTIYFTPAYSTNDVTFNGNTLLYLTDLTIQGGWNGLTGSSFSLSGNTVFTVPVSITNWNDNITVNNITVNGADWHGLYIDTSQDISINDSTFTNNTLAGVSVSASAGNVSISNSTFSDNDSGGANISPSGNVVVSNSTFINNAQFGLGVDGDVVVSNSVFSNNVGSGLVAMSNVEASNSTFSGNRYYGLLTYSDASISSCTFSGNGGHGALINGGNNATISNSTFSDNQVDGANISADNVAVSNSTFSGNDDRGLSINSASSATINGSTFNNNATNGLFVAGDVAVSNSVFSNNVENGLVVWGNIDASNSTFSGNESSGLLIYSNASISSCAFSNNFTGLIIFEDSGTSNVVISNTTFSGNADGIWADAAAGTSDHGTINLTINDSKFSGNGIGIDAIAIDDYGGGPGEINLTLNCVQFENNTQDLAQSGDVTVTTNPCHPDDESGDGFIIIPVTGDSVTFSMDCSMFSGYIPVWSNGDRVLITCVPNGTATVSRVDNTTLPNSLEAGYQYVSGYNVQVLQNGVPLIAMPGDGYIQVSFAAEESAARYSIMYWDGGAGAWDLLESLRIYPDRADVTTIFTGTYLLVIQE